MLEIWVRRSPTKASKSWKIELQQRGINVAESTVRLYLKKLGLVSRYAAQKPLLTARHKKLRLAFARRYASQPPEFWRNVLFTDETRVSTRSDAKKQLVRRKTGERLNFITPTVKYPAAVMLWGCFAASGPGRIRFLEKHETCNTQWYLKVLGQQVRWSAASLFTGHFVLQDDGAPCHRSKQVKDFVAAQHWQTLDWPPQSPDLNPIENLWALLKRKLGRYNFNTTVELKAKIISIWHHNLEPDILEKLALSMPSRLNAVIKARGGHTNY